jgi:hypothetical protein
MTITAHATACHIAASSRGRPGALAKATVAGRDSQSPQANLTNVLNCSQAVLRPENG